MSDKVVGTLVLEGLIQGPLAPGQEASLKAWAARLSGRGIRLHLQTDGGTFSFVPDGQSVKASALGDDVPGTIAGSLEDLLEVLDPAQRLAVMSTIRSMEYQSGKEIQTIYAVGSDGRIDCRSRTVEARTVEPAMPMTRRQKLRLGGTALGILVVGLLISSLFIDYRQKWADLVMSMTPYDAQEIQTRAGAFDGLMTVGRVEVDGKKKALAVELNRGPDWAVAQAATQPAGPTAATAATTAPVAAGDVPANLPRRLAVESLARGYVRLEAFDKAGKFIGFTEARVADLWLKESVVVYLPLTKEPRIAAVSIVP